MTPNEQERLVAEISSTAEVMGTPLSEGALVLMAGDLAAFPLPDVIAALQRTRREHQGRLTIAAIFERLPNAPRTMTADEAWSMVLRKEPWNEERTCVLPRAAMTAWYAAADLYRAGDRIGARMAFKGAWPAAVAEHGSEVAISEGWNREDRARAIEQAVAERMIGRDRAWLYGVEIGGQDETSAQIEGPKHSPEFMRERIAEITDILAGKTDARAIEEKVELAEAMVRLGHAPNSDAGVKQVEAMTGEEKAALAASIKDTELAEMANLRKDRTDVDA